MFTALQEVWDIERKKVSSIARGDKDSNTRKAVNFVLDNPSLLAPMSGLASSVVGAINQLAPLSFLLDKEMVINVARLESIGRLLVLTEPQFDALLLPRLITAAQGLTWLMRLVEERLKQFDTLRQSNLKLEELDVRTTLYRHALEECIRVERTAVRKIDLYSTEYLDERKSFQADVEPERRVRLNAETGELEKDLKNVHIAFDANLLSEHEAKARESELKAEISVVRAKWTCSSSGCDRISFPGSSYCPEHRCRVPGCINAAAFAPDADPVNAWIQKSMFGVIREIDNPVIEHHTKMGAVFCDAHHWVLPGPESKSLDPKSIGQTAPKKYNDAPGTLIVATLFLAMLVLIVASTFMK